MRYISLGVRGPKTGLADQTGNNSGNWTVAFTPNDFNVNVLPSFEIYKISVSGARGSTCDIFTETKKWDTSVYAFNNSWEGSLSVLPGETVYFYYSDPITDNTPPVVTIWLRYDADIAQVGVLWHGR